MKFTVISAIGSALLLSVTAHAQDAASTSNNMQGTTSAPEATYADQTTEKVPDDVAGSFGGFRIEGNVGWDKTQAFGRNNEKLGYGGSAGFDGNLTKHIIVGPEFSYWQPNRHRSDVIAPGGTLVHEGREIYGAAIRVGYRAGPDLILFAKGGYANQSQRTYVLFDDGSVGRFKDHVEGYQVGGGFQYALHDHFSFAPANLYLSGQYVYSRFDNRTVDQHAMAGVGFKFR